MLILLHSKISSVLILACKRKFEFLWIIVTSSGYDATWWAWRNQIEPPGLKHYDIDAHMARSTDRKVQGRVNLSHAFGWLTWSTHLLNHFSPSLSTRRPLIKRKYWNHFSELQSGRVTDLDFQCSIRSLDWWSRVNINGRNVSGKGGSIPRA